MSHELEALLEAFHAVTEAPARDVAACDAIYQARLEAVSIRLKIDKVVLHRMVLKKHLPWLRANTKPTSPPPKA